MQLTHSYFTDGSGFVSMTDGTRFILFVFFCKDEMRRVLLEHAENDERAAVILRDMDQVPLPETSSEKTVMVEGTAVITLNDLTDYAVNLGRETATWFIPLPAQLFSLFLSDNPAITDALIGFVDRAWVHHVVVYYSREQMKQIMDDMPWLDAVTRQHLYGRLRSCGLPERAPQAPIDIAGPIAGWFNFAYALMRASCNPSRVMN